MNAAAETVKLRGLRSACNGTAPLSARLEGWQIALCAQPEKMSRWLDEHGSPLNILDPSVMAGNAQELELTARAHGLDFRVFFARKANKALTLVDEATRLGLGVDLASERELFQTLGRGVPSGDLMMTAAIKPRALLKLCVESGTTVAIDNEDELHQLTNIALGASRNAPVALRLAPILDGKRAETRFGIERTNAIAMVDRYWQAGVDMPLDIVGVHFHLDGYEAGERVTALAECLTLVDALRERGHRPKFIDMGGGVPMSYLASAEEWSTFWEEHRRALIGEREPLTFEGHGLGLAAHGSQVTGRANVYPYYQRSKRGAWLEEILAAEIATSSGTSTVAEAIRVSDLQLRCEPGRALLDGCGLTAARVEFRKQRHDGTWLVGVAMNRTQCRSTSDDFLVDPLLLRPDNTRDHGANAEANAIDGYLVGAYCIERELLTWRRMHFAGGVQVGDIVVFPNTAGYLMHILESSSHQMPLARNVIIHPGGEHSLDPIDVPTHQ